MPAREIRGGPVVPAGTGPVRGGLRRAAGPKPWKDASPMHRALSLLTVLILAPLTGPTGAAAQGYPAKPIRIVVPFAPGGGVDVVARTTARHLGQQLGVQTIVENRAGASGNVGAELVSKAERDGHMLLVSASTLIVNPVVAATPPPFDPIKAFTHLALIAKGPLLLVVHPGVAADVKELVAKARANPAALNFATGGYGSAGHMAAEAFKLEAGLAIPVVLYAGTGPAINDLVGGHISGLMDPLVTSLPLAQGGKARALAITNPRRLALAPDVPTFAEAGFGGFEFYTWYGLWGPPELPADVVQRIGAALAEIGRSAEARSWFEGQGLEYAGSGGAPFVAFALAEQRRYEDIVKRGRVERK